MSREIKFEYIFLERPTGKIIKRYYTLEELENIEMDIIIEEGNFNIVARRQFTGLTDKQGKEIYEGDVVKRYDDMFNPFFQKMVVKFDNMFPSFKLFKINYDLGVIQYIGENFYGEHNNPENLEVIGDIYTNPELIK